MLLYINNFKRIDRKTKKIDHEFLEDNNKINPANTKIAM